MLPQAEGFWASRNPRSVVLAGGSSFRASPDGLALSRFGWADVDTGYAANARTRASQLLGFVFPAIVGHSARTFARGIWYARPGVGVTLMSAGDFWVRFTGGASVGARVYASLVDGSAISGEADAAEPTPWYVASDAAPGGLAIISTYSKVTS